MTPDEEFEEWWNDPADSHDKNIARITYSAADARATKRTAQECTAICYKQADTSEGMESLAAARCSTAIKKEYGL